MLGEISFWQGDFPEPALREATHQLSRFFRCCKIRLMLDDGQFVYSIDRGNALGLVAGQAKQLKQQFPSLSPLIPRPYANIVLAGMGGSALAAELIRNWLGDRLKLPFVVVRDYHLPAFVGQNSLVFVSSYSGNTEETLSMFAEAKARGAQIVALSAGGELMAEAKSAELPLLEIPAGIPQRLAALSMAKAIALTLDQIGATTGAAAELEQAADWLEGKGAAWVQTVPAHENLAKQIADKLLGSSVVIYSGPVLAAAAQKWKISINENAKNVAFYYLMSEFNHNEFQGWLKPETKLFKVIELQSSLDHPKIAERWEISNRLLSGKMPSPIEVKAEGETKLQQLLWTQLLGDFVGVYLGILNKVDPSSVDLIETLKKDLS